MRSADGKKFAKSTTAREAGIGAAKGKSKAKSKSKALAKPDSMPARPLSAYQCYAKEQTGKNLAMLSKGWKELGEDGQKKYVDQAAAAQTTYAEAMAAWEKTKDGKKFQRAGEAQKQRAK